MIVCVSEIFKYRYSYVSSNLSVKDQRLHFGNLLVNFLSRLDRSRYIVLSVFWFRVCTTFFPELNFVTFKRVEMWAITGIQKGCWFGLLVLLAFPRRSHLLHTESFSCRILCRWILWSSRLASIWIAAVTICDLNTLPMFSSNSHGLCIANSGKWSDWLVKESHEGSDWIT